VEFAKVIHASGQDLLRLINEILDLSKVESGIVTMDIGKWRFSDLQDFFERSFRFLAKSKNLDFRIELDPALAFLQTDGKRLEQILKNLLANAFKFTAHGGVRLQMRQVDSGWNANHPQLSQAGAVVAFSVTDTGIGIAPEKQKLIFEAFQQGDGTTSRNYGGTGLGLTISRELARLLGGEIQVRSVVGEGSEFTLYLPVALPTQIAGEKKIAPQNIGRFTTVRNEKNCDDRASIQSNDRVFLCIEDDPDFAACLLALARQNGFKGLLATHGQRALELVQEFQPDAITLDLTLPDIDGWKILERLKNEPATRHIPVAIISADEERNRGLRQGAMSFLTKPAKKPALEMAFARLKSFLQPRTKKLLLVESKQVAGNGLADWIGNDEVKTTSVAAGRAALAALKTKQFDCMVLDLGTSDRGGFHLLDKMWRTGLSDLPIILYRDRDLSVTEEHQLQRLSRNVLIKHAHSRERLLDQTALFLHLRAARLPEPTRELLKKLHCSDSVLAGKKALIVDDDIRNIFALTSLLERHGMQIVFTENGRDAIKVLQAGQELDIVLLDIMMPGFDGYSTMRAIRQMAPFKSLPIVAVTAKAMKEDRAKCLRAGASDYVAKPVDAEQLLMVLRLWLHR